MGRLAGLGRSCRFFCLASRAAVALIASAGCSSQPVAQPHASSMRAHAAASTARAGGERFDHAEATSSPHPLAAVPAELAPFVSRCGRGDAALSRVAERFARRQSRGHTNLDVSEIGFALRAEGSPYVWPRAWTLQGGALLTPEALDRLSAWLKSYGDGGERRCGVALAERGEQSVLAVIAVDVLADLSPIAVRQRTGSWVDVDAALLVDANEVKVIVLGPSGAPAAVPTSFDGRRARARFRADRRGAFLIQVLASVAGGPRPLLEATVYADSDPPASFFGVAAPGEPATPHPTDGDAAGALLDMINGARNHEQLPPLGRDRELDAIAFGHAVAMRQLGRVAHEAGDGDPQSRVEAANLPVRAVGENVAHALDATLAHRALWASPSHRENLLEARFDRVGIGVARDDDGSLWVCELFADFIN